MRKYLVLATSLAAVFMFWCYYVPDAQKKCADPMWGFASLDYSGNQAKRVEICKVQFCNAVSADPYCRRDRLHSRDL